MDALKRAKEISTRQAQLQARIMELCIAKERDPWLPAETIELMKKEAAETVAEMEKLNAEMMNLTTQSANVMGGIH